jgi:hypothetical protein
MVSGKKAGSPVFFCRNPRRFIFSPFSNILPEYFSDMTKGQQTGARLGVPPVKITKIDEAVPKLQFWNCFLRFKGKTGAFDRFFQEPVPKSCALAHSQLVLEQAQVYIY